MYIHAVIGSLNDTVRRAWIPISTASVVLALVVVVGIKASSGGDGVQGPIVVDTSAYPWSLDPEAAIRWSKLVVVGSVEDVDLPRWTTADGNPPTDFMSSGNTSGELVFQTAHVRVERVVAGEYEGDTIPVTVVGGTTDDVEFRADDFGPGLEVGDQLMLFLAPPTAGGTWDFGQNWTRIQTYLLDTENHTASAYLQEVLPISELEHRVGAVRDTLGEAARERGLFGQSD